MAKERNKLFYLSVIGYEDFSITLLKSPSTMSKTAYFELCKKVEQEELSSLKLREDFITTEDLQAAMVERLCEEFHFQRVETIKYEMESAILQDKEG